MPLFVQELNSLRMSALFFLLPKGECGRDDVTIVIDYFPSEPGREKVHCSAWAQVGKASLRGLVDTYTVPYLEDQDRLEENIILELNKSTQFKESLAGFIASVTEMYPGVL